MSQDKPETTEQDGKDLKQEGAAGTTAEPSTFEASKDSEPTADR